MLFCLCCGVCFVCVVVNHMAVEVGSCWSGVYVFVCLCVFVFLVVCVWVCFLCCWGVVVFVVFLVLC